MDYNTSRKHLVLPEYGRNIQKMVLHIKTVEDRDERNRLAKAIIQIMGNMNPHLRDVADFKHKLWDHLAIISDFELDVDSPYPTPEPEELNIAPDKLPYKNAREVRYKHYGRVLESMIKSSIDFPEGEEKDFLIEVICTQMKKSFVNWNRESVTDDMIFHDFKYLTRDQVKIPEGLKLKDVKDLITKSAHDRDRDKDRRGGSKGRSNPKHNPRNNPRNNPRGKSKRY